MSLRNCLFGLFAHNAIVRRRSPAPLFAHAWRILPKVAIAVVWTSLTICRRTRGNPSCASHHRFPLSSFFFLFFTCWPCPSFLLIFNTFSNSFSDFPSYFVYQRRHFWSRPLAGVSWRRISSINVVIFCTKCYSRWGFGILRRDGIIVAGWIHCVLQLIWKNPLHFHIRF